MSIPEINRCIERLTSRVLIPNSDRGTIYCVVELPEDETAHLIDENYIMYDTTRPAALPAEGDATAPREVEFPSGLVVDVVPDRVFGQDYPNIASAFIDPADVQECVLSEAPDNLVGLYTFSPEGNISGDAFSMRFPNRTALAAGSSVELFAQGGLSCTLTGAPDPIEEAEWEAFGTGTVSADGADIEVDVANGLPCFNWFGYRAAP